MKEIREEFETFLQKLVASYAAATNTVAENPTLIKEVGGKSRDFDNKVRDKISELAAKNKHIDLLPLKAELTQLRMEYHGKVIQGYL